MSIIYKREIYLSILSFLFLILLFLLFFMYKNYRYIVQRQKSSRDPFCRSNDRFQRLVKMHLKALSFSFTIFWRLQQTWYLSISSDTFLVTCYYWLQRSYICLLLREGVSYDIFIFHRSQALRFRFYRFQISQSVFFLSDFYKFSRENKWVHQKGSYNCQQINLIRFSRVHSRIMMTTRSPRKKRIVESAGRNNT